MLTDFHLFVIFFYIGKGTKKMNNQITVSGIITSIKYDHEKYGEQFYLVTVHVEKACGSSDSVPVIVSYNKGVSAEWIGKHADISGQLRSYKKICDDKKEHVIYVVPEKISFSDGDQIVNKVHITGFICKKVVIRKSALKRSAADVLVAVDKDNDEFDYIPCVLRGRSARLAAKMEVGECISLCGRIQCREYIRDGVRYKACEVLSRKMKRVK